MECACCAETIVDVTSQTGVSLDPEFCVKAVRGMVCEMQKNPGRFAGKRVLFIHSGNSHFGVSIPEFMSCDANRWCIWAV